MDKDPIVIVAAKRTAIGNFLGGLSGVAAVDLGAEVMKSILQDAKIDPSAIDDVILGQVLTAGAGQNPARQAAIKAGITHTQTAMTINQVCGSGLRAVALGAQSIMCGDADIILAGGQENMSLAKHALYMRGGTKMGNAELDDTMIRDGLWDAFNNYHMGITAENISEQYGISRNEQDEFAAHSQQKCEAAIKANKFQSEIIPLTIKNKKQDVIIDKDEFPRAGTSVESLSALRPAFKPDGTVTAGNASGINDGAAVLMLMTLSNAVKRGLTPLVKISSYATAGVDPKIMGTGPVPASQKALAKAGWSVNDLDLIESNEAFAAQSIAVMRDMKFDPAKVNIYGGAISLGHPIGASGARVLVTLIHALIQEDMNKGLATLCIGGGMGIALCVERLR